MAALTESKLVQLESKYLIIQSDFKNIIYEHDPKQKVWWIADKSTGQSIEVSSENINAFVMEFLDVSDLHKRVG